MNVSTKPLAVVAPTFSQQSQPTSQAVAPTAPQDSFEPAPQPGFTKPNYRGVTAEKMSWGESELLYTVRRGDTLASIAKRLGVTEETLAWTNEVPDRDHPSVGQKITLPSTFHVVKRGDTYWDVAQKTGIDARVLMALNDARSSRLMPGQTIRVPAAVLSPEQARLREQLQPMIADSAKAYGRTYFGEDRVTPFDYGNLFGWYGPVESTLSFEYSDDFDAVRIIEGGESDEGPVENTNLNLLKDGAVAGTERLAVTAALRDVLWLQTYQLSQANPQANNKSPMPPETLSDGRIQYRFYDLNNAESRLTYDPKAEAMTVQDPAGTTWSADAKTAADAVVALGEHLGVKMPEMFGEDQPDGT